MENNKLEYEKIERFIDNLNNSKYKKTERVISRLGTIIEISARNNVPLLQAAIIYKESNIKIYSNDLSIIGRAEYDKSLEGKTFELTDKYFGIQRVKKLKELRIKELNELKELRIRDFKKISAN